MKNFVKRSKNLIALQKKLYRCKKKNEQLNKLVNDETDSKDMQVLSEPFSTYDEGYTNNVQTERTPVATPLSKTISFMDFLSSPIPDIDKNKIKKKIFELNVLSNSLESQYKNTNTNVSKAQIKNIADYEVTKKYRMKSNFSLKLAKDPENRNNSGKRKRNTDSTDTEVDSDVTYAETSECEGYEISEDLSSEDERKCTEVHDNKEKLKTEQKSTRKKNMFVDREITEMEERKILFPEQTMKKRIKDLDFMNQTVTYKYKNIT
ncbi:unnamed protein product [Parnassius apollo]|uniref:(apollo) hypothetical protein n=1 Tax=Parnassius apollo TaxID=110799 RepID=A0A8S3W985_PARAO|nr:unnamed protein product [Parnassius apollo]